MKISLKSDYTFSNEFPVFFVFFFYFLNWYSLFWINENEFEKLFPIFWTDFLFPVFFSLLKWLMKISLKSFNFRINWWNFFISKKWILAPKTSKKYNRQKWNLLSSRSPLSKIMSILLFLIKSSLFSWFFVTFVGTNSFLLLFYYRQLFFALHFLFFDFNFSFFAFLFFQLSVFFFIVFIFYFSFLGFRFLIFSFRFRILFSVFWFLIVFFAFCFSFFAFLFFFLHCRSAPGELCSPALVFIRRTKRSERSVLAIRLFYFYFK